MLKDVLRTFEAEFFLMFLKKDTFSRSPKLRRSYKKECFELKEFLSKKHDIDVAHCIETAAKKID